MLNPNRPILAVGSLQAFRFFKRHTYKGDRPLEYCASLPRLQGRSFIMDDIVWLHGASNLRDYDEMYRYALYIDSIYNSRDNDESGAVRGGSEATPHTD